MELSRLSQMQNREPEQWRVCPLVPRWLVSSRGRVASRASGRILRQQSSRGGYRRIHVADRRHEMVHRLVASAFLPAYSAGIATGLEIDHINRNASDNRPDNLRLVTHRQNVARACGQPVRIGNTIFPSVTEAAESEGVSTTTIREWIVKGYRAKGGPVEYASAPGGWMDDGVVTYTIKEATA